MSEQRWPKSPDTPTMIESGVPGLRISFWHGLWTTKGTPKAVVDRLDAAVMTALADPAVRQRLEVLGQVIFPRDQQNPAALAAYPQGRDRQVVADHQGGRHQGRMIPRHCEEQSHEAIQTGCHTGLLRTLAMTNNWAEPGTSFRARPTRRYDRNLPDTLRRP